ncbi:SCO1664 family protein [Propionibacteriaceae bacterium Y2011]
MTPAPSPLAVRDLSGPLTLTGRLLTASNASFVAELGRAGTDVAEAPEAHGDVVQVVYKPVRGERELWDFPTGTLANREVAAYRVSAVAGFDCVPFTDLVDGPLGPGSAQVWVDADSADDLVDVVAPDLVPDGWFPVMYGEDERADIVVVAHAPDQRLRRLAVFDALINNADRKAGHLLPVDGRLFGCDHGISFHTDPKLRTLVWGWAGEELTADEEALVRRALTAADDLAPLLADDEIQALVDRGAELLAVGLPTPRHGGPAVPWPLW